MMNATPRHPDDLLAFYVNDSLSETEQQDVETHIATCERCQHELTLLRSMYDVVQKQPVDFPQEFAWQRLKRDIKQQAKTTSTSRRSWWQPAVGIAAAVIIGVQGVLIFDLKKDVDSYTQAGYQRDGVIAQIKFNPQAKEAQLSEVLLSLDAEIVAGPSAKGLYRVRLSERKDDPAADEKFRQLQDNSELIIYVAKE